MFLGALQAIRVVEPQTELLILPNVANSIEPFKLEAETESEKAMAYRLEVKCSENVAYSLEFNGTDPEYCSTESKTGTIESLNGILQGTNATILTGGAELKDLKISYNINYTENGKSPLAFEQQLTVATEIPVHRVNKKIYYQPGSSTGFNLKVLEIQDNYYRNASSNDFTIVLSKNRFPDWLEFQFVGNDLYFSGRTPRDLDSSHSFSFTLQDKQTGLSSSEIEIEITSSIEGQAMGGKTMVVVLFLIFTGVIGCILLIIFVASKKKRGETSNLKHSVNAYNQGYQDTTTNVLSDSILQWNKKLVERYKTKSIGFIPESTSNESPERSPGFAYENFDASFEISEERRSPNIKISDRLSEIKGDSQKTNRSESNKSSFFDDIRL